MWPNPQFLANFITFTEEIVQGKLNFLCSGTVNTNVTHYALAKTLDGNHSNNGIFRESKLSFFSLIASKHALR